MQAIRSSAIRVLLAAVALLAAPASALYAPSSLLALRIGDGVYCPSANISCSVTAPLYLDEYSLPSGALVSSVPVPGATLPATDGFIGSLSRSADGTSVAFGANTVPPGTASIFEIVNKMRTSKNFAGARVIVRVNSSGGVDKSTQLSAADYNGTITGVCSMDGGGFWIAGDAPKTCISYAAFGSAAGTGNVLNVAHDATCATAAGSQNSMYTGCTAISGPNRLFFTRTFGGFNFIDQPAPPTQSALWTTSSGLSILGAVNPGGTWNKFGDLNNYYSQMVVNRAQTSFWVLDPADCSIDVGTAIADLPNMPLGTTCPLVGGIAIGAYCSVSGLTLSLDEMIVSAHELVKCDAEVQRARACLRTFFLAAPLTFFTHHSILSSTFRSAAPSTGSTRRPPPTVLFLTLSLPRI